MIPDRDRPTNVTISGDHLHITLANGRTITRSLADYPILSAATAGQQTNVQLNLGGIRWPELNLDISLLEILSPHSASRSQRKGRICEG